MAENFTNISYHDNLKKRVESGEVTPAIMLEILRESKQIGLLGYDNARHIAKVFLMLSTADNFLSNEELIEYMFEILYDVYITEYFNRISKDVYYSYFDVANLNEKTIRRIFSMIDFKTQRTFNKLVENENVSNDVLLTVILDMFSRTDNIKQYFPWMLIFYRKTKDTLVKERARKHFYDLIPDDEFLSSEVKDIFLF